MAGSKPQVREVAVIETMQEIAPGIVEVDEYVIEGAAEQGGGPGQLGGPEQD